MNLLRMSLLRAPVSFGLAAVWLGCASDGGGPDNAAAASVAINAGNTQIGPFNSYSVTFAVVANAPTSNVAMTGQVTHTL